MDQSDDGSAATRIEINKLCFRGINILWGFNMADVEKDLKSDEIGEKY